MNTDLNTVKTNLAPFIMNNFFCNYLSGNYMDNNLLYVITLMLKDEIDKLESIEQVDNFLENTKCGFLLEELIKMPDIQIYFKNVILKTVENIERTCFRELKFDISEKEIELIKLKESEEKRLGKKIDKNVDEFYKKIINSKLTDQSINNPKDYNVKEYKKRSDLFIDKYAPDITGKIFESLAKNAKKENKNDLFEYYNKFKNDIKTKNDEKLYSNELIMKEFLKSKLSSHIVSLYQDDFLELISFVEQLLKDLMNNILLLPNTIKYICKIISKLVQNKFKNITKIEENAFISKFLIGKLLIPIISFPSSNALISDFVISGNTLKNISIINIIINKLFSGKLFINNRNESNYTPFNWVLLDEMESILLFLEKVININLPNFIEKFVNNELPKNYSYDYFTENKEQIYASISICFNINNLFCLINGLEKTNFFNTDNPNIKKFHKSFLRLCNKDTLNKIKDVDIKILNNAKERLKKNEKIQNIQNIEIQNLYLYNGESIEKKYGKLFKINNKIANFYIDIKKEEKTKKLKQEEKNIIKVKNYLCSSLVNYRILNKSDFNIGSTSSTIKMLNEIKSYMSIPNFILNNNTIPSVWYINSILDYLNKIPEDYKENEFKKLFNELIQDLNNSINELDFEILILFRNKLKFLDKMNNYYSTVQQLVSNISINEKTKCIVEELFVPVDIIFKYDNKEKKFELTKSHIKEKAFEDKIMYQDPKKNIISFRTIEAFTRYFPNLSKYQLLQGISPIDLIKELSINQKFNNYFMIIKEYIIIKSQILEIPGYENIYKEKIKDYIMNKIYDKIYPPEPDDFDNRIFKKSMLLSWVEPNLIVEGKDYYIYDTLMPDILNEFKKINIEKTPNKKLNCIKKILEYITNLIKFNEGEDKKPGAEDIIPVLNYVFIKAHPYKIYTDLEYIKTLYDDIEGEICGITNIESIYSLILECTHENFKLSKEEFDKRCRDAIKDIDYYH